jgi:hypothetical protein
MGWICDLLTHSAQLLLTLKRDPRKEQCSLRKEDTEPQTWTESQTWTDRITWSFVRFYLLVRTCIEKVNTDDFSIFVHLENTVAPSSSRGASVPETFEKCACMILIPSWSHEDVYTPICWNIGKCLYPVGFSERCIPQLLDHPIMLPVADSPTTQYQYNSPDCRRHAHLTLQWEVERQRA